MPEHELEKLIGGFAADTLTAEERTRLYSAALHDQVLFNALADEQALKELLADPAVRRRLLEALDRLPADERPAWLDWLRLPAPLALAGGLAAGALALVLGIRTYQESLLRTSPVVSEETRPEGPAVPHAAREQPFQPAPEGADRGAPVGSPSHRPANESEVAKKIPAPTMRSESHDPAPKTPERPGTTPIRPGSPPQPPPEQAPGSRAAAGSARALFYGGEPMDGHADRSPMTTPEKTGSDRRLSAPQRGKLLGLRYGLVMKGPGGIDLEVDPATPVGRDDAPRLRLQTNENGYLSALASTATPLTLFPSSGNGQVAARQTIVIPLDGLFQTGDQATSIRVLLTLSRIPFKRSRPSPDDSSGTRLLIDQVNPSQPDRPQEQAIYVVDPNPDSGALTVEIPVSLRR